MEALKMKRKDLEEKAKQLAGAGENAWKDLKSGIDGAFSSLENAVNAAKSRFQ